jgi:A/G-specific adenine glycosylase
MGAELDSRQFRRRLLAWFDANARDLPWRRTDDPYAIWVSEIMLQQTRVAAVIEHYGRFMERFPTLQALAEAEEDAVLACWSGLGYYRRARLMHKASRLVVGELGGKLPSTSVELRTLPGIGEYTCAAIASIGFGEAIACVDGNVERVLTRVRGWSEFDTARAAEIRAAARDLLDATRPGDFNQAMMELGATICLPRGPLCLQCPVQDLCATRGEHPVAERKKMLSRTAAYAFLQRAPKSSARKRRGQSLLAQTEDVEVLLEQRPGEASLMAGMWELPEIDGTQIDGAQIEGTRMKAARRLLDVRHSITVTNYYVTIYGYEPSAESRLPVRGVVRRWVSVRELAELPLTGLTRKVLKRLKALPGYTGPGPAVTFEEVTAES